MLEWLKRKSAERAQGKTDFQGKLRENRARVRVPEYQKTSQWMAEKGGTTTFNCTSFAELLNKARFRPGLRAPFLANQNDIVRKLAHGGGEVSYLVGMTRSDDSVFVVWWVWRDKSGNYAGLKPYYSLGDGESPSDYWVDAPDAM
ncbi:hypothetical protein [Azospirillum picis]|uniref:Uncharacterized protein n=1 Tax=Azospirillum picis TaxID=488438 RepID=A0ABU0MJC7_9PROT|nr:hypothetical protein [Azospirillum picis]MBP2299711.1 hypothetical protein [Azospirillum picis]MDQ0533507.1 hypothetical protein [Azospirillum picis]